MIEPYVDDDGTLHIDLHDVEDIEGVVEAACRGHKGLFSRIAFDGLRAPTERDNDAIAAWLDEQGIRHTIRRLN